MGLPMTQSRYDSVWVIVDRLTKVAHFIPIKTTYTGLHGAPKKVMSDRGTQFTSRFWERLHETLDTQLRFRPAYHPQTQLCAREMQMLPILLLLLYQRRDAVMDKMSKQSHDSYQHTHLIKSIINHNTNDD
jgi:transposase InsO family protein